MIKLGSLEKVDLREIWLNEAQDFTPWLAEEENLKILGETIGLELELEAIERNVGPFRADILCKDASDDSWILIENQLAKTDHQHLGQLLTYAASLHTASIVWIAAKFSEEHRAALDWLNEITQEKFRFFGLEVELWRIGDSIAAPKFNVISKPNNWSKSVSKAAQRISDDELNPTKSNYVKYWDGLTEYLKQQNSKLKPQKARPSHWNNFSIGRSSFRLASVGAVKENWIAVELTMNDENAKNYYNQLLADKTRIETELGFNLEWRELPDAKVSRIRCYNRGMNPLNHENWVDQFSWLKNKLEAFDKVFRERIKRLSANDLEDDESFTTTNDLSST